MARLIGLRTLGDLHGRTRFELLQYKACGWRTIAEIHQLIERAICGKFHVARMEESRAITELLTLLERGIAKLAPRDRAFLIAKIRGMSLQDWPAIRVYASVCSPSGRETLCILKKDLWPPNTRTSRNGEAALSFAEGFGSYSVIT